MIHLFEALGATMTLDVGSGAVHAAGRDRRTTLLSLWSDRYPADIVRDGLSDRYSRARKLEEAVAELRQLEAPRGTSTRPG